MLSASPTTIPCATCGAPMGDDAVCRNCLLDLAWFDSDQDRLASEAEPGRSVGGWILEDVLGRGAMSVVYRARRGSETSALKMLRPGLLRDADLRGRFDQEMRVTAALRHPHILPVLDVGEHDGMPFLALALAEGGTLASRLSERGPMPPVAVIALGIALANAAHHAHQLGVLHRDVKPGNILLDRAGTPFLADFGIARLLDPTAAGGATWTRIGTPAYMAPEQVRGLPATAATDVFGLAAVLWEAATGTPPIADHATRILPPGALSDVLTRALSEDPAARHATAQEFAAALLGLGIAS